MEFAVWLLLELFNDWFTVLTFVILTFLGLMIAFDIKRYGLEVDHNEIEDVL